MSIPEWLARRVTYPMHECLRGRRTMHELRTLERLATTTPEAVQRDAADRLRTLLSFAQQHLPYYAQLIADCGVDPQAEDLHCELAKLPVLTKTRIRAHADRMVCYDVPGGPVPYSSGGTTS